MASHEALGPLLTTPDYQAFCRVELDDPYELLDTLRSIAPVHWSPLLHAWVVTSYQGVTAALGHPRLSSDRSAINARGIPDVLRPTYGSLIAHISNWLGFTDPPRHSRLRRLARSMLNPALAAAFRPWITAYVRAAIAEIRCEEHVDLLDRLALRLPLALICAALGVPHAQAEQFHRWTCDVGPFAGRVDPSWSADTQRAVDRANQSWLALEDMFRALIREKQRSPGDDLLTRLVSSTAEGTISDDELIGLSVFFLAAGHGTTRNLVASGLYLLMTHPAEAEKLSRAPELIGLAVEEVLRYESPIPVASRLALADLTLGGATIRAGDSVIVHLAGANRDPAAFDDPATFDVTRQNNRHLAFGRGPHFCLGAPLARAEAAVVFEEVGHILPRLVLDKPNPRWRTGDMTDRCLTELKASWKS
ncbi:MAG TPA: cytochrome P450 [Streptosporangiaceae bacterium]|jgi:cytochrome P450|nr:cytochrome P450 [Streptosporangiaceae bacterium]